MKRLAMTALAVCLYAAVLAVPVRAAEMRGLWVDAFHPGIRNPAQTSATVTKAKACNFNALFVQVRKRGNVLYGSKIEPMASEVVPGYDPLADVIEKAHAAGMEVHAWVTMYEVYHEVKWRKANPQQIHLLHPEWLAKDGRGRTLFPDSRMFLDPSLKEVQDYLVGIISEIATNYNVDGIQIDSIRYPMLDSGYSDAALAQFSKETGITGKPGPQDKKWCEWRRNQVTDLVSQVYAAVTRIRPEAKVSAVVFPGTDTARNIALQDWVGWIEQGIVDFAVPMVFAEDNRVFAQTAAECISAAKGRRHVYIGHAGWDRGADQSVERIASARDSGAPGTLMFSYWYCSQQTGKGAGAMDALRTGPYAKPDITPGMSWKHRN